jgi:putative chitinase
MSWSRDSDPFQSPLFLPQDSASRYGRGWPGDIERWSTVEERKFGLPVVGPTQCFAVPAPPMPEALKEIPLTEADLLRFVGRDTPFNQIQAGIFQALVQASTKLWFLSINTSALRLSHFLAQCHAESGGFTQIEESLNYREAAIRTKFGDRGLTEEQIKKLAWQPRADRVQALRDAFGPATTDKQKAELEAIIAKSDKEQPALREEFANRIYSSSAKKDLGNGSVESGDGYKFRGRGIKQITGRWNYTTAGKSAIVNQPLESNPDLVATDYSVAVATAVWYWDFCKLNQYADQDDAVKMTQAVNLGTGKVGTAVTKGSDFAATVETRKKLTAAAKAIWVEGKKV